MDGSCSKIHSMCYNCLHHLITLLHNPCMHTKLIFENPQYHTTIPKLPKKSIVKETVVHNIILQFPSCQKNP